MAINYTVQAEVVDISADSFIPIMRVDKIGIDTGACFGGPLTAINLPNEIFYESK